jgi:hypothetical protein
MADKTSVSNVDRSSPKAITKSIWNALQTDPWLALLDLALLAAIRAGMWVTVTTVVLLLAYLAGDIPAEELSEIPLLTMMIVVAFAIARQRSRAEDTLRSERDTLNTIMENTQTHLAYLDPEC